MSHEPNASDLQAFRVPEPQRWLVLLIARTRTIEMCGFFPFVGFLESGYCSFFEELIVFSKLESSMQNRQCFTSANLSRIEYGESNLDSQ